MLLPFDAMCIALICSYCSVQSFNPLTQCHFAHWTYADHDDVTDHVFPISQLQQVVANMKTVYNTGEVCTPNGECLDLDPGGVDSITVCSSNTCTENLYFNTIGDTKLVVLVCFKSSIVKSR